MAPKKARKSSDPSVESIVESVRRQLEASAPPRWQDITAWAKVAEDHHVFATQIPPMHRFTGAARVMANVAGRVLLRAAQVFGRDQTAFNAALLAAVREHTRVLQALERRQRTLETEYLPRLLERLSEINQRQLESAADEDNLLKSTPVALRALKRDIVDLRTRLAELPR